MGAFEELDKYRAPALDKGLDILELLARTPEGMTQAEIAKALDRGPNEIYRMLDRLVRRNYVQRILGDRYEITLKLFELAYASPPMQRLVNQAMPVMRRFARDAEQSCHLVVYDRNILVVVAQVDGPGYWNLSIRVGSRLDMINTGSGHVFLAFATPEERELMLEDKQSRRKARLPAGLEERLQKVREEGYERMVSLQTSGVTNLAAPVFGPLGSVMAAFTCPFTRRLDRHDAPDMDDVSKLLLASSREISQRSVERASAQSAKT